MSTDTQNTTASGNVYRMLVRSADEAVQTIREKFGSEAKVISVRQVEGQGITGLFTRPKLEVLVQVGDPVPASPAPASFVGASTSPAEPPALSTSEPVAAPSAEEAPTLPSQARILDPDAGPAKPVLEIRRSRTDAQSGTDITELLRRSGFSESFITRLSGLPSWAQQGNKPLHVTLVDLGRDLRRLFAGRRPRPLPARTAFIGSMGVGRTTALCKWLGAEVFAHNRRGRVLKVEFDRPNPAENLAIYSEALGLSLEHYSPDLDLSVADGEFLYADLPGFEFRRSLGNHQLASFLDASRFEGRVLVLNALYDHSTLRAAYTAGKELGATHLVFTHCDELIHWGKLMDILIDGDLSPLFLATGPSLSGDCDEDCFGAVLRKTIPGA